MFMLRPTPAQTLALRQARVMLPDVKFKCTRGCTGECHI
jgi:hypothetical protein